MSTSYKCLECRDVYPHGAACDCDPSAVPPPRRFRDGDAAVLRAVRNRCDPLPGECSALDRAIAAAEAEEAGR